MEKDRNFKKMANFFKFFLFILGKLQKTDDSLFFLSYFPPGGRRTTNLNMSCSSIKYVGSFVQHAASGPFNSSVRVNDSCQLQIK